MDDDCRPRDGAQDAPSAPALPKVPPARLIAVMKDFRYQIYRLTDAAKFIPSRVNPSLEGITLPDEEQTFPELLERIEKCTKYLESFSEKDFEGKQDDEVIIKFPGGQKQVRMPAAEYISRFAHPNMW